MMQSLTNQLKRVSSLKTVGALLVLLIVTNILINGKPYGLAQLSEIAPGATIPDMELFGYSPQRAYEILAAQGEAGRAFYLHVIAPQDFPFPLFYGLFLATALTYLAQRLFPKREWLHRLGFVGLGAGLADWLENLCLITLSLRYPTRLEAVAVLGSGLTVAKTVLMLSSLCALLFGTGWLLVRYARARFRIRENGA